MAIREIITGEEPILRSGCEAVSEFGEGLHQLLRDLEDTMRHANGFGLAAPQIGVPQQVCVVDIGEGLLELINPQITARSGSQRGMEGCLSFPGVSLEVERPERISVEANDRFGASFLLEAEGLLARTICHEVDHLHGVLFFDLVDEADFFGQFLKQAVGFEPNVGSAMDNTPNPANSNDQFAYSEAAARKAVQKEVQLIADLIADAAWKTELALQMLEEYPEFSAKQPGYVRKLKKLAKQLGEQVDVWEQQCEMFKLQSERIN